jgi:hypothetical protein
MSEQKKTNKRTKKRPETSLQPPWKIAACQGQNFEDVNSVCLIEEILNPADQPPTTIETWKMLEERQMIRGSDPTLTKIWPDRFYQSEWKLSAYAHTMDTFRTTGEIPVVPRSSYKTVGITEEHDFDLYFHHTEVDKKFAECLIQVTISVKCDAFSRSKSSKQLVNIERFIIGLLGI